MPLSWRLLLLPISFVYCWVVAIRNRLYHKGIIKSRRFELPVLSIGNLTVGGTGKTPLTEYLFRLLMPHWQVALLSRGYGRKTKGVLEAGPDDTAISIGDEPMQMKLKFPSARVVVAEKRVKGMEHLLASPKPPQVVLLDDAFQHRALTPGFSILVMDYFRPVYRDWCLPAGNLREPAHNAARANLIVVNKCPLNLSEDERQSIIQKLKPEKHQSVFFSSIGYLPPQRLIDSIPGPDFEPETNLKGTNILALAGIGNPGPFFAEIRKRGLPVTALAFGDHHEFTPADLQKIEKSLKKMGPDAILITTEKMPYV